MAPARLTVTAAARTPSVRARLRFASSRAAMSSRPSAPSASSEASRPALNVSPAPTVSTTSALRALAIGHVGGHAARAFGDADKLRAPTQNCAGSFGAAAALEPAEILVAKLYDVGYGDDPVEAAAIRIRVGDEGRVDVRIAHDGAPGTLALRQRHVDARARLDDQRDPPEEQRSDPDGRRQVGGAQHAPGGILIVEGVGGMAVLQRHKRRAWSASGTARSHWCPPRRWS